MALKIRIGLMSLMWLMSSVAVSQNEPLVFKGQGKGHITLRSSDWLLEKTVLVTIPERRQIKFYFLAAVGFEHCQRTDVNFYHGDLPGKRNRLAKFDLCYINLGEFYFVTMGNTATLEFTSRYNITSNQYFILKYESFGSSMDILPQSAPLLNAPSAGVWDEEKTTFSVNLQSGIIQYPSNDPFYQSNLNIEWSISVTTGNAIRFYLIHADLQGCCCDYIELKPTDWPYKYFTNKIFGCTVRRSYIVYSTSAAVKFVSDETKVGRGFKLAFEGFHSNTPNPHKITSLFSPPQNILSNSINTWLHTSYFSYGEKVQCFTLRCANFSHGDSLTMYNGDDVTFEDKLFAIEGRAFYDSKKICFFSENNVLIHFEPRKFNGGSSNVTLINENHLVADSSIATFDNVNQNGSFIFSSKEYAKMLGPILQWRFNIALGYKLCITFDRVKLYVGQTLTFNCTVGSFQESTTITKRGEGGCCSGGVASVVYDLVSNCNFDRNGNGFDAKYSLENKVIKLKDSNRGNISYTPASGRNSPAISSWRIQIRSPDKRMRIYFSELDFKNDSRVTVSIYDGPSSKSLVVRLNASTSISRYFLTGPQAFIHFQSDLHVNGTKFELFYEAIELSDEEEPFIVEIKNATNGEVSYPLDEVNYSEKALAWRISATSEIQIRFEELSLCYNDVIKIFNGSSINAGSLVYELTRWSSSDKLFFTGREAFVLFVNRCSYKNSQFVFTFDLLEQTKEGEQSQGGTATTVGSEQADHTVKMEITSTISVTATTVGSKPEITIKKPEADYTVKMESATMRVATNKPFNRQITSTVSVTDSSSLFEDIPHWAVFILSTIVGLLVLFAISCIFVKCLGRRKTRSANNTTPSQSSPDTTATAATTETSFSPSAPPMEPQAIVGELLPPPSYDSIYNRA